MLTILFLTFIITLYLLPTIVASFKNHLNTSSITVINIFLGWTFLGWVICLAWAFSNNCKKD